MGGRERGTRFVASQTAGRGLISANSKGMKIGNDLRERNPITQSLPTAKRADGNKGI